MLETPQLPVGSVLGLRAAWAETLASVVLSGTAEIAAEPEGIVAFADSQLATASDIAAALGLRFNPPAVTARFLDKFEQRAALQTAGIPVPGIALLPTGVRIDHANFSASLSASTLCEASRFTGVPI